MLSLCGSARGPRGRCAPRRGSPPEPAEVEDPIKDLIINIPPTFPGVPRAPPPSPTGGTERGGHRRAVRIRPPVGAQDAEKCSHLLTPTIMTARLPNAIKIKMGTRGGRPHLSLINGKITETDLLQSLDLLFGT